MRSKTRQFVAEFAANNPGPDFLFGFAVSGYLKGVVMMSDCDLLRDYAEHGSEAAFRQLVDRHLPLVYRAALRQLNADTHRAEDVAQVVFVALARQSPTLIDHPNLAAWLYATTHRTACQYIRTEMRRRRREEAWAEESIPAPKADEWAAIAPVLDASILSLRAVDREAVVLRYFGNRSFAEIATTLRLTEDAARMRVNRALELLRERLRMRGLEVGAGGLAEFLLTDASLGAPAELSARVVSAATITPAAVPLASAAISLMTGSKLMSAAVAVVAAAALGVATQQWSAARAIGAELDAARQDALSLQAQLAKAKSAPVTMTRAPLAAAPAPSANRWADVRVPGDAVLAAHPEIRDMLIRAQQARIRGKYLPLYQELHLTNDQISEFEALLLSSTAKIWNGIPLFVGETHSPAERDSRIRALLGDDGFAKYQSARMPNSSEVIVEKLAARLAMSDEPLAMPASIAVRDAIDQTRGVNSAGDSWPDTVARLSSVLSPAQLDALKAIAAQDRYQRALDSATLGKP